jgi:hypothetical protein
MDSATSPYVDPSLSALQSIANPSYTPLLPPPPPTLTPSTLLSSSIRLAVTNQCFPSPLPPLPPPLLFLLFFFFFFFFFFFLFFIFCRIVRVTSPKSVSSHHESEPEAPTSDVAMPNDTESIGHQRKTGSHGSDVASTLSRYTTEAVGDSAVRFLLCPVCFFCLSIV